MSSNNPLGSTDFKAVFSNVQAKLTPFSQSVERSWFQVTQFAKEKMGQSDVTELPQEYKSLEQKVDSVKQIYEAFTRISRNYTLPAYDYEPPLNEKVIDFASSVTANATMFAEKMTGQPKSPVTSHTETPPSLSHAFAKAALESSSLVPEEEPFGAALKKFAVAMDRAGNLRIQQDQDATLKFHNPLITALNDKIANALKARRNVQNVRLTYDACRARLRAAPPNRADVLKAEMEKSEDEFVAAVDDAMGKMKAVIESNDALRCLSDLVAIQLQYHKGVFEVLSELSPEIDELVVTNEALYAPATSS